MNGPKLNARELCFIIAGWVEELISPEMQHLGNIPEGDHFAEVSLKDKPDLSKFGSKRTPWRLCCLTFALQPILPAICPCRLLFLFPMRSSSGSSQSIEPVLQIARC